MSYQNHFHLQAFSSSWNSQFAMSASPGQTSFGIQLAKSNFHSSSSWHRELEIAKALKIAQDDENTDDEAIGLEQLGDVYAARVLVKDESLTTFARVDPLILAASLYNSSLVRTTQAVKKSDLESKLRRIEEDLINLCGQSINKSEFRYDVDSEHKKKLKEFRQTCREKLKSVQSKFKVFVSPLQGLDEESEAKRAEVIKELFIEIQAFVKELVSELFDECVQVLGQAPEEAGYAFIGFGSFARGEMTPFSDLESALLVEEGKNSPCVKDYFVKLTEYFNFKVLNLQETILPSMCIPSLNPDDQEMSSLNRHKCTASTCSNQESGDDPIASRDDWPFLGKQSGFYDDQMRGISVDARMRKAAKTPLGSLVQGRGNAKDLIKTPTELAQLYVTSLKSDRLSNDREYYNLSTVLSNVSFLYGTDPGLIDMYDCLVLSMTDFTEGDTTLNVRQTSAVYCLENALDEFQFSLNASDVGLISSIKKKLYRVVGMLVMNLGKFQSPGVVDNSPWNILKMLAEAGVISSDAYRNLVVVVGIVNEARLTSYLRCGRQDELFSFFDQSMDIDFELAKNLFVRYFYTVFPFQKTVRNFLSSLTNDNDKNDDEILFPPDEQFYEYSHLNAAIALSLTSNIYFQEMMEKFSEALENADDESTRRLCLAFLSCLHPDYSTRYCQKILDSSVEGPNSEWRVFSFLIGALASFHRDKKRDAELFLEAATNESSSEEFQCVLDSRTKIIVQSYQILVRGLLKFRELADFDQQHSEEALGIFNEAVATFDEARELYEPHMKPEEAKTSLFVLCCIFMKGRCHMRRGDFNHPTIEYVMRQGRAYTGNGHYMRILYHAYMLCLQDQQHDEVAKHCEKVLELFLRFRCPKGQQVWSSILAQGIVLAAMFLGFLYREMGRVDDALRIFQLASSRLVPKALEYCTQDCHVGREGIGKVRMYVEAFTPIFKLLEADCFGSKGSDQEMWTCVAEAVSQLVNYRGTFQAIELRDVFASTITRERSQQRGQNTDAAILHRDGPTSTAPAPNYIDTFNMAPLLESWCDTMTRGMQFILFTTERDVYGLLLTHGTRLISEFSSNSDLTEQFRSNPYQILSMFIPMLRHYPDAHEMVRNIFSSFNNQGTAVFKGIWDNVVECQRYAVDFTDMWVELLFLFLRMSLCHDLLNALELLK